MVRSDGSRSRASPTCQPTPFLGQATAAQAAHETAGLTGGSAAVSPMHGGTAGVAAVFAAEGVQEERYRITFDSARPLGLSFEEDMTVSIIAAGGQAAAAGIDLGMRLVSVDGTPVAGAAQLIAAFSAARNAPGGARPTTIEFAASAGAIADGLPLPPPPPPPTRGGGGGGGGTRAAMSFEARFNPHESLGLSFDEVRNGASHKDGLSEPPVRVPITCAVR